METAIETTGIIVGVVMVLFGLSMLWVSPGPLAVAASIAMTLIGAALVYFVLRHECDFGPEDEEDLA